MGDGARCRAIAENYAAPRRASGAARASAPARLIALALEPEPCCFLETIDETVALLRRRPVRRGGRRAAGRADRPAARGAARRAAPPPRRLLRRLPRRGGVRGCARDASTSCAARASAIPKLQLSAGAAGARASTREAARAAAALRRAGLSAPGGRARRRRLAALPRPARGARRRSTATLGDANGACTSTCRSSSPSMAALRDHAGLSPRDARAASRAADLRRISRSRPTPGTCCRERYRGGRSTTAIARELNWVRQRARSRMSLADRAASSAGSPTCRPSGPTCSPAWSSPAGCWRRAPLILLLVCRSRCSTSAACILNDAFDARHRRRQRPERPIPSGQVSARTVFAAGFGDAGSRACSALASVGGYERHRHWRAARRDRARRRHRPLQLAPQGQPARARW